MIRITQLNNYRMVLELLCANEIVLRLNTENNAVCNLQEKSLKTIRRDFEKDCYIYFALEEV